MVKKINESSSKKLKCSVYIGFVNYLGAINNKQLIATFYNEAWMQKFLDVIPAPTDGVVYVAEIDGKEPQYYTDDESLSKIEEYQHLVDVKNHLNIR